jgi:hypothetical protein
LFARPHLIGSLCSTGSSGAAASRRAAAASRRAAAASRRAAAAHSRDRGSAGGAPQGEVGVPVYLTQEHPGSAPERLKGVSECPRRPGNAPGASQSAFWAFRRSLAHIWCVFGRLRDAEKCREVWKESFFRQTILITTLQRRPRDLLREPEGPEDGFPDLLILASPGCSVGTHGPHRVRQDARGQLLNTLKKLGASFRSISRPSRP